jgi:hypothetical protein
VAIDPEQKALWLRELELNGFIILRNFLPAELVTAMHDQLLPILRGELSKAEKDGFQRGEELVDACLGQGGWKRGWSQVETVWQGASHMDWHSDQTPEETPDVDAHHRAQRMIYNIPLVDFTWANGAMEIIPGSHRLSRSFLGAASFVEIPNIYSVPLRLQRGDAVFRDGNALHRGTPNLTDHPRPMLDQTYKKLNEQGG